MSKFNEEQCLQYNPFEGDFGDSGDRVISDKIVTTRKEAQCNGCLSATQKGERTRSMSAVFDGAMRSYRWCYACCHAFSLAESDDDEDYEKGVAALIERENVRKANEAAIGAKP